MLGKYTCKLIIIISLCAFQLLSGEQTDMTKSYWLYTNAGCEYSCWDGENNMDEQNKSNEKELKDKKIFVVDSMPKIGDLIPTHILKEKDEAFLVKPSHASFWFAFQLSYNNTEYSVAFDTDFSKIIRPDDTIAFDPDKAKILYIETCDEKFETPEGFSMNSTFKGILKAMDYKLLKKPNWCFFIPLPSGWNAAFVYGENPTFEIPDDDTKVEYFFREKDPWGLAVDYEESKKKK